MKSLEELANSLKNLAGDKAKSLSAQPNSPVIDKAAYFQEFTEQNSADFPITEISHPEIQDAVAEHLASLDLLTDAELRLASKDISKNAAIELARMLGIGGRRNTNLAVIEEKAGGNKDNLRTKKSEKNNEARFLVDLNSIKSGGMGEILYGFDLQLHRPVAIKRVKVNDDKQRTYLKSEAKTHAKSENQNVVKVYALLDVSSSTNPDFGGPALVMEYLDPKTSPTLTSVLRGEDPRKTTETAPWAKRGIMPPQEIIRFVSDMMKALGNDNSPDRILHLDLKPSNIFQTPSGYKLTDFGLSNKVIDPLVSFGTPLYISPEKATGYKIVDIRSELFSLTSIVYEMIAGHNYWEVDANGRRNSSSMDVAMTIVSFNEMVDLKPHTEVTEYCQKYNLDEVKVLAFFRKAWAHEEDDRAQNFVEYLSDLQAALTPIH